MIKKITSIEELLDANIEEIWGNNWIGKMIQIFFSIKTGQKIPLIGDFSIDRKRILIADQEVDAKKSAEKKERKYSEACWMYLQSSLKDEIDRLINTLSPETYETEVLILRKQETDQSRYAAIRDLIDSCFVNEECKLFNDIEIETVNRCNGTCSFCPINAKDETREYKKMSEDLFDSIIDQLSMIDYRGKIALFSNNEPLLDDRICRFARKVADKLPDAYKVIFTNGILLNQSIFDKLIDSVDLLNIDIYYDKNPKSEISQSLKEVLCFAKKNMEMKRKIMIQLIPKNALRNNRGGQSKNRSTIYKVQSSCLLPFIQMIVRPDGKTSLCCNDAKGIWTLADLNKEPIDNAWNNENYTRVRNLIREGRQSLDFCRLCDNFASRTNSNTLFTVNEIEDAWKNAQSIIL